MRFATGTGGRAAETQNVLCLTDKDLLNNPTKAEGLGNKEDQELKMSWNKIQIPDDILSVHLENRLISEFSMIFWSLGGPVTFALFEELLNINEKKDELCFRSFYFSPEAVRHSAALLVEYKSEVCAEPKRKAVELLVGRSTFWEYYKEK